MNYLFKSLFDQNIIKILVMEINIDLKGLTV